MSFGSPAASVAAKACPDPGVPLKPPVPQPQLINRPSTGVLPTIGLRSGVTSTTPPHWRIIFIRETMGTSSHSAPMMPSIISKLPRCEYDTCRSDPAPITNSPLSDWLI